MRQRRRRARAGRSGAARPTPRPPPSRGSRGGTAAARSSASGACGRHLLLRRGDRRQRPAEQQHALDQRRPRLASSSESRPRTCIRRCRPKQSSGSTRARAISAPATSSSSTDGSPGRRATQWSSRLKPVVEDLVRGRRERARLVGDLPLQVRLGLAVAVVVEAVGDAVDAEDALGCAARPLDAARRRRPRAASRPVVAKRVKTTSGALGRRGTARARRRARRVRRGRSRARCAGSSTSAIGRLRSASPGSSTSRRSSNISPTASLKPSSDCLRTAPISLRFVGGATGAACGAARPCAAANAAYSACALRASASRCAVCSAARAWPAPSSPPAWGRAGRACPSDAG